MADIFAVFGFFLFVGIALPGLLTTYYLIFPKLVDRARLRLTHSLGLSVVVGLVLLVVIAIPITILLILPAAPLKALGVFGIFIALAVLAIGLSGFAARMAHRFTAAPLPSPMDFIKGAVTLTLALEFPIIGWLILTPLVLIAALGATAFALLNWLPKPRTNTVTVASATPAQS